MKNVSMQVEKVHEILQEAEKLGIHRRGIWLKTYEVVDMSVYFPVVSIFANPNFYRQRWV